MQRRDFLTGGAGLIAAGLSGSASAQELVNPRILELIRTHWCFGRPKLRRNIYHCTTATQTIQPSRRTGRPSP